MPEVHSEFQPHRERIRNRNMIRVKVVNRNTLNLTMPEGQVISPGESTFQCYEDNEAAIMAQVERDEAAVSQASKHYKLEIAEQLQTRVDRLTGKTAEDVAAMIESGDLDEYAQRALAKLRKQTGSSFESAFYRANKRGIRPLVSAEVVERNITEPQRQLQHEESTRQASILAQAMREAWGNNGPGAPQQNNNQKR